MIEQFHWSPSRQPEVEGFPPSVGIFSTTRHGGVSNPPFDTLNLGFHVGDDPEAVRENRRRLKETIDGEVRFCWLSQVHGTRVVDAAEIAPENPVEADASVARRPGRVCVVMTADCLPVVLCDRRGTVVAAAHAGWRGLAAGVVEATVEAMGVAPRELIALLGPAIGADVFEVGDEVRRAFVEVDEGAEACFRPSPARPDERWVADLYELCRRRLRTAGVRTIAGEAVCTYADEQDYFSYRRDGETGRMATGIWLRRNVPNSPDR